MSEDFMNRRRQFLQGISVGGAALVAGCSAFSSDDDDDAGEEPTDDTEDNDEDETGNGEDGNGEDENGEDENGETDEEQDYEEPGEGEREVGIIAQIDQEAAQALGMQLQQGEIDQEEFLDEANDLIDDSLGNLTDFIESDTTITIQDELRIETQIVGALRAFGPADDLIDAIESDHGQYVMAVEEWDELKEGMQGPV